MKVSKFIILIFGLPLIGCIFLLVTFFVFPISKYPLNNYELNATEVNSAGTGNIFPQAASSYNIDTFTFEVPTLTSLTLPEGYELDMSSAIPGFISLDQNQLIINATKNDTGEYRIYLNDPLSDLYNEVFFIDINLLYKSVDIQALNSQVQDYLATQTANYGYFVYDLNRDISFGLNQDMDFRAASMVKVPIAITVLREVQEGRISLDTVYPLRSDLVFNYTVGAGENPIGSGLTVRDYLEYMIILSDNTSLAHLDALLSDIYGSELNSRIRQITGVDFYVYPPEATPRNVATVLKGLYNYSFIDKVNSDYLINLMFNAAPDLKQGIGLGLPGDILFANKIGFLDTTEDLSYMDSAIVYGTTTNYVLVILNKNQDWEVAKNNIKNISTIIYNNLN